MPSAYCVRELRHEWDPVSGWCLHGCSNREDRVPAAVLEALEVIDVTEPRRSPHTLGTHTSESRGIPGLETASLPVFGSANGES